MIIKYKGFLIETDENVYEPSDDTYLLLDSLEKVDFRAGSRVLEVGCGTGIVSIAVSGLVASVVACDINPHAVDVCKRNAARNKAKNIEVVRSDLFSDISGNFDLIVFNTPYLPQSLDETVSGEI
ncbi:MAG: methyltransferase, partial [Candidatus Aenigmarchaeota archaeon]|nr:methyltransferase [Candidatus Aenigmarchaeota archaeon]